jgi:hypothetical protein
MLDALGNLGDFIGGIAVVATLLYLAVQIRHNSRVAALAAGHSITSGLNGFLERIALDAELHSLWSRAIEQPEALDESERDRFGRLIASFLVRCLDAHRHGDLDREIADRYDRIARHYLSLSSVRSWWDRNREVLRSMNPELTSYINEQLAIGERARAA